MRIFHGFVVVIAASLCASAQDKVRCPDWPKTKMIVNDGSFFQDSGIEYKLKNFSADLVPRGKSLPGCLAKLTEIEHGQVTVGMDALGKLFAAKMSKNKASSISDLELGTEEGEVVIKGKAKKLIPIPFELKGPVDVVDGTKLRFHAKDVKAGGLPAKSLLKMLGMHMGEMINKAGASGVTATDEYIVFDPKPLAHIQGTIRGLKVLGDGLYLEFGPVQQQQRAKK